MKFDPLILITVVVALCIVAVVVAQIFTPKDHAALLGLLFTALGTLISAYRSREKDKKDGTDDEQ